MPNANVLSVLLNFKSDISGLNRFTSALQGRLQAVEAFNTKFAGGVSAINTALQAGAALFATAKLKEYTAEAIAGRKAQAQLEQALAKTGQNSAQYRAELAAQANTMQRLTGVDDDYIKLVQRELIFSKAKRADLAELTSLTLDFAAAKNLDAGAASKLVGKSLTGDEEDLKRYGVELGKSNDRVAALKEGLRAFRGQAEQSFNALPEDVRRFQVASNDASKSAGNLVLQMASPFVAGFATGLERINERMDNMRENGSFVLSLFKQLSSIGGEWIGKNLDKIIPLIALFLALKTAIYLADQSLFMMGKSFVFVAGQQFLPLIGAVQALSKEVGILRAVAAGGWTAALGAGLAVLGAGAIAFAGGTFVINQLESAALNRLAAEDRVRQVAADQTKEFTKQLATIKSIQDARNAAAGIEAALTAAVAERDVLEAKKKKASTQSMFQGSRTFTDADFDRLKVLDQQIFDLAQRYRLAVSKGFVEGQIQKNTTTTTVAAKDLTPEQRAAKQELADKQALFELETQIREAEFDKNDALQERLIQERDEFLLQKDLGSAAYELVRNRLDLEAQERAKKRADEAAQREEFRLETEALAAEAAGNTKLAEQIREQAKAKQLAREDDRRSLQDIQARLAAERGITEEQRKRQREEQLLSQKIAGGETAVALIEKSQFLTDDQKNRAKIALYEKINALLAERIEKLRQEQAVSFDIQRQQQIDDLQKKQGDNTAESASIAPLSMGQSVIAGVIQYLNEIPTLAQRAQQAIYGIASAMTGGIAASISGLINRTMTWRDALLNIGQSVVQSLIGAFANMVAQWIAKQLLMALFGKAIQAAQLAALAPIAAATAMMWAPAATAASIATFGGAAIAGAAMAKMAILSSIVGFATGGIVPGGEQLIRINEQGTEAVLNARATAMLGPGFINAANAGALNLGSLSSNIAGQLPVPGSGAPVLGAAGADAQGGQPQVKIFNAFFSDEPTARQWLNSKDGKKNLIRMRGDLGLET